MLSYIFESFWKTFQLKVKTQHWKTSVVFKQNIRLRVRRGGKAIKRDHGQLVVDAGPHRPAVGSRFQKDIPSLRRGQADGNSAGEEWKRREAGRVHRAVQAWEEPQAPGLFLVIFNDFGFEFVIVLNKLKRSFTCFTLDIAMLS